MAFNTKSHLKVCSLEPIHGFHTPMALFTVNILLHMPFMIKEHVLRKIIDLFPWNGGISVKVDMLFFYLRVIRDNVFMAKEALLHSRYPGMWGSSRVGVTKQTLDLFHSGMHTVTE